ncbi:MULTISPECIES: glutamate--tRNA ligase [unclassified Mycoplasma]|uniref:glutamate--tRNA ligase n=1 Tax=unclassified Mycoplasma TaxID=2683645 RepID=UPI00211C8746|nr:MULTISPECIES: glutamate--tRNA ligase [unclassified Mycoplasma]UUM19945.1 glutamate--tRNA ligase [Mycoplasma sp. 1578d]UUM24926.1 glutamate--tRNA ligase [Mycoplasma sp. 3686d]
MKKIRTRYAPSPTGYLHIGGARTALFNYLFAKHFNGDFIFRLEDTDVKRNVQGGEESQLNNLQWLGIVPDESPIKPNHKYVAYRQSEKLNRYKEIAQLLIDKGLAYKAYDTAQELDQQKEESDKKGFASFRYNSQWLQISEQEKQAREAAGQYSIRLKMPKNQKLAWNDIVRGLIEFDSNEIADWVIFKSDGYPTYNFAVVVDDHDMEITHVLRGEEHIGNTPKQLVIYQYLNWDAPQFGHLTIITNMEGKKLSKRDTSLKQFIQDYKNEGYIPQGIFNFLALLGWTSADASELMNQEELIEKFDPQRLSKSPSKFDISKMNWFSKQYLKQLNNSELINYLNSNDQSNEWLILFVNTFKESCSTLSELKSYLINYSNPQVQKKAFDNEQLTLINTFFKLLKNNTNEFSVENIQQTIDQTSQLLKLKGKKLFMPIRIATTNSEHGPELAKAIYLFGKEIIFKRLAQYEN